jgi:hypothetical protein
VLETFRSSNFGPVGYVNAAAVRFSIPSPLPRANLCSPGSSPPLPRVDII